MEKAELDENKSENLNNDECGSYDLSEGKINKFAPQKSKKISLGTSTLHILPAKLKDTNKYQRKPVDELFEKYIKKNEDIKDDNYDCTLFRGRLLNGKKINLQDNDNFKINYVELIKEEEIDKCEYKILNNKKVNEYYVWKYDSGIEKDNNLIQLENNIKKLDILS